MTEPATEPTIEQLVEQHYQLLYGYAFRLCGSASDAEDLTQQTFLIGQSRLGQLRDAGCARAWLCAIMRNCFRKELRKPRPLSLERLESLPAEAVAVEQLRSDDIDEEELQQALAELPEEFRTPVILFYFGDLSYREIAQQMFIPIGTVMSRLARGKAHLRARLFQRALAGNECSRRSSDGL